MGCFRGKYGQTRKFIGAANQHIHVEAISNWLKSLGQLFSRHSKASQLKLNALKEQPRCVWITLARVCVLFGVDDVAAVLPDKITYGCHHAWLIRARKKKNCSWSQELKQYCLQY